MAGQAATSVPPAADAHSPSGRGAPRRAGRSRKCTISKGGRWSQDAEGRNGELLRPSVLLWVAYLCRPPVRAGAVQGARGDACTSSLSARSCHVADAAGSRHDRRFRTTSSPAVARRHSLRRSRRNRSLTPAATGGQPRKQPSTATTSGSEPFVVRCCEHTLVEKLRRRLGRCSPSIVASLTRRE